MNEYLLQKTLIPLFVATTSISSIVLKVFLLLFITFNFAYAAPSLTNLTINQTVRGNEFTFNWDANGTTIYGWELQVGPEGWEGKYTSPKFGPERNQYQITELPQDGSTLLATLSYATGPGQVNWVSAEATTFMSGSGPGVDPTDKPSITNLTANQTVRGNLFTFNWDANGTTVHAWELRVGPDVWLGKYTSPAFGIETKQYQVTGLPQDGSTLFATLRYATDPGRGNWETVTAIPFTSTNGTVIDPTKIPVFLLKDLRDNAPALEDYSLEKLGKKTPELPDLPQIPPVSIVDGVRDEQNQAISCSIGNLLDPSLTAPPDSMTDWKNNTNRNNPIVWLTAAAEDSDIDDPTTKTKLWQIVNTQFRHLLAESLPMSADSSINSPNNVEILPNFPTGSWVEHSLVSYIIPYAELVEDFSGAKAEFTFNRTKEAIIGHANWLASLKTDLHDDSSKPRFNGPAFIIDNPVDHANAQRQTNFRAWMRLFKNMVAFSESEYVKEVPSLSNRLVDEANKMIRWLLDQQADHNTGIFDNLAALDANDPALHDTGWIDSIDAYFFDVATVINNNNQQPSLNKKRNVWMRFLEIWHGVLEQVKNTDYYDNNRILIDEAIDKTVLVTNTIINTSVNYSVPNENGSSRNFIPSLTNFRAPAWYIDLTAASNQCTQADSFGDCHQVFVDLRPIQAVAPVGLLLNYQQGDGRLAKHIGQVCDYQWNPNYRYIPAVVSTYTRIQ